MTMHRPYSKTTTDPFCHKRVVCCGNGCGYGTAGTCKHSLSGNDFTFATHPYPSALRPQATSHPAALDAPSLLRQSILYCTHIIPTADRSVNNQNCLLLHQIRCYTPNTLMLQACFHHIRFNRDMFHHIRCYSEASISDFLRTRSSLSSTKAHFITATPQIPIEITSAPAFFANWIGYSYFYSSVCINLRTFLAILGCRKGLLKNSARIIQIFVFFLHFKDGFLVIL